MENMVWHFIWLPRMHFGWPSFLMKLFEVPVARRYSHRLNTWGRLEVCNKLCCTVLLGTKLMCRDFTFQHHSGLGFGIKRSTVPMMLPKQVFTSPFLFCEWSVYHRSICHLGHLIINPISSCRATDLMGICDKCQVTIRNKYSMVSVLYDCFFLFEWITAKEAVCILADGAITWGIHCRSAG